MCEYCKNLETEDDYKPIVEKKLDCGLLGKASVDVAIVRIEGNPVLELGILPDKQPVLGGHIKIKYCPMCGRMLT